MLLEEEFLDPLAKEMSEIYPIVRVLIGMPFEMVDVKKDNNYYKTKRQETRQAYRIRE